MMKQKKNARPDRPTGAERRKRGRRMELRLDLHVHSAQSIDGQMSLGEIIDAARSRGLDGVAVCEHDRLFQPDEELEVPEDFLLIPGEEFTTEFGHVLGLFLTKEIRYRMCEYGASEEAIFENVEHLCASIHEQGGLCVVAHPFKSDRSADRLLPILGWIDGIETWNARAGSRYPEANSMAALFARIHRLPAFAGSDAHLKQEVGNGFVTVEAEARSPEAVREALKRLGNPVSGDNCQRKNLAKSQYIYLKNTNAGSFRYLKWSAFALRCAVRDLLHR
jgi:predicted metal-dependent phosphoesterase TrpH